MFVLFINDMHEVVKSCIELFADDSKISKTMSTEQLRPKRLSRRSGEYRMCDTCLEAVREENDRRIIED